MEKKTRYGQYYQATYNNGPLTPIAIKLKKQMDDLVDVAYEGHRLKSKFKAYGIQLLYKETATFLGDYHSKTRKIRLFYIASDPWEAIIVTLIHELTHHIDYCIRGTSGHDKEYYEIHVKLLKAAMDMGIVSKETLLDPNMSHARNKNKVAKMIQDYIPSPITYKENLETISVFDAFEAKATLKEHGYIYNGVDKSWVKEVLSEKVESEIEYLKSLELTNITVHKNAGVSVRPRKSIHFFGNLYNCPAKRKLIKEHGYSWNNSLKCWIKQVEENSVKTETTFLKDNFPKDCYYKIR